MLGLPGISFWPTLLWLTAHVDPLICSTLRFPWLVETIPSKSQKPKKELLVEKQASYLSPAFNTSAFNIIDPPWMPWKRRMATGIILDMVPSSAVLFHTPFLGSWICRNITSSLYILLPLKLEKQLSPHSELLRSKAAPRALWETPYGVELSTTSRVFITRRDRERTCKK